MFPLAVTLPANVWVSSTELPNELTPVEMNLAVVSKSVTVKSSPTVKSVPIVTSPPNICSVPLALMFPLAVIWPTVEPLPTCKSPCPTVKVEFTSSLAKVCRFIPNLPPPSLSDCKTNKGSPAPVPRGALPLEL